MKNKRKRERRVFISYVYGIENGHGFSNTTQYTTKNSHITPEEIRQAEKEIKEQNKYTAVTVLSYQIM